MTREEAIERYDRIRYNLLNHDDKEAVDIAFEALREQDVTDTNVGRKTNADHIRSMSDEELAEFLCDATYKENEQGYPVMRTVNKVWWHKWLKQPYKEET